VENKLRAIMCTCVTELRLRHCPFIDSKAVTTQPGWESNHGSVS